MKLSEKGRTIEIVRIVLCEINKCLVRHGRQTLPLSNQSFTVDLLNSLLKGLKKSERAYWLERRIEDQEKWIESCGGSELGYIERYGVSGSSDCFGNGGKAIYEADLNELSRLRQELAKELSLKEGGDQ